MGRWRPRGASGWVRLFAALATAGWVAAVGLAMLYPAPFNGALGAFGTLALSFPLHLVLVAALTLGLAARARTRLTAAALIFAGMASIAMAAWPSLSLWRFAAQHDTAVSLGDYFAHAAHFNLAPGHPDQTVAYTTTPDGITLSVDIWRAAAAAGEPAHPAMVRIHGGAFVTGSRSDMPDWDRWFAGLGYTVFDIDYRLPPPVRWQDEIADVKCALGWVAAHAAEYGIDPGRISITGFSAGGTLAMLAAYSTASPRLPPSCDVPPVAVRSVVNLYGVPDMPKLYDTSPSRDLVQDASAAVYRRQSGPIPRPPRSGVADDLYRPGRPADDLVSRGERPDHPGRPARRARRGPEARRRRQRSLSAAGLRPRLRRKLGRLRHPVRPRQDRRVSPPTALTAQSWIGAGKGASLSPQCVAEGGDGEAIQG